MKNKNLRVRYFLISFLITFTLVTMFGVLSFFSSSDRQVSNTKDDIEKGYTPSKAQDITFLLIGEGEEEKQYSLMHFSSSDMALYVVSLPNKMVLDSKTLSGTQSYGGAKFLCEKLSEHTGCVIDRYIRINKRGFISILDDMDSVYLQTEEDIHYYSADGYSFSLSKGEHILPAEKVYNVMRFNTQGGEEDRLNKQTRVLCEIVNQKLKKDKIDDAKDFFNVVVNIVDTNITAFDFDGRLNSAEEFLRNGKAVAVDISITEDFSLSEETKEKITLLF